MVRKKTVSISTKPSSPDAATTGDESAASSVESHAAETSETDGATDLVQTPALGRVGTVVYGTVYCLSYGVMFSVIMLGTCIPGSALIGRAWQDGTGAARRKTEELRAAPESNDSDSAIAESR